MQSLKQLISSAQDYPTWLLFTCGGIVLVAFIYILTKAIKWLLYISLVLLLIAVLVAGAYYLWR